MEVGGSMPLAADRLAERDARGAREEGEVLLVELVREGRRK